MSNEFEIKYSYKFIEDLNEINYYIKFKLKNKVAAVKLTNIIEEKILERSNNAENFEKYITPNKNIYYRIYIKNYIIFYTITNSEMIIRRIIYKKRNYSEFFK